MGVCRTTKSLLAILVTAWWPQTTWACAVCFGDPNSEMVRGAKAGVFVLMLVVYGVLFTMAGVVGAWALKARKVAASQADGSDETQ
ncbi:MAG: hypothetical protein V3W34_04915 [Phycisphaerae bacterium]